MFMASNFVSVFNVLVGIVFRFVHRCILLYLVWMQEGAVSLANGQPMIKELRRPLNSPRTQVKSIKTEMLLAALVAFTLSTRTPLCKFPLTIPGLATGDYLPPPPAHLLPFLCRRFSVNRS